MSKILTGIVVSNKSLKTIIVDVQKKYQHAKYHKILRSHKKFKVHIEDDMTVAIGDIIQIQETRPISKDKHYRMLSKAGTTRTKLEANVEPKDEMALKSVKGEEVAKKVEKVEVVVEKKAKAVTKKAAATKTPAKKKKVTSSKN